MIRALIEKAVNRSHLTQDEAFQGMEFIMQGKATPAQIAAFITALRMKGENVDEITGCALAMRKAAAIIKVTGPAREAKSTKAGTEGEIILDTCGTGGDGAHTFNISTTVALVAAGAGLIVAKHGNRSVSSRSGSADVLEALGVDLNLAPGQVKQCIDEVGIGFLFAPLFHPAMKFAIGPRREIGIRTIFNILGPLTNPANANTQILGVYHPDLTEKLALVLGKLGIKNAMVVHGHGKLDEFSILGPSRVSQLADGDGKVVTYDVQPHDFGLETARLEDIRGGDAQANAVILKEILKGKSGPKMDAVLMNTAAVFVVAGRAKDFKTGVVLARESINSGKAAAKLEQLIEASQRLGSKIKAS